MMFTPSDRAILEYFSAVTPQITFFKGHIQKVFVSSRDISATAKMDYDFPLQFSMIDVNRLLRTINLISEGKDYNIEFQERSLRITGPSSEATLLYHDDSVVYGRLRMKTDEEVTITDVSAKFVLTQEIMTKIKTAVGVLGVREITLVGKDGVLSITTLDSTKKISNQIKIDIGKSIRDCRHVYIFDSFRIAPGDYAATVDHKSSVMVLEGMPESKVSMLRYTISPKAF